MYQSYSALCDQTMSAARNAFTVLRNGGNVTHADTEHLYVTGVMCSLLHHFGNVMTEAVGEPLPTVNTMDVYALALLGAASVTARENRHDDADTFDETFREYAAASEADYGTAVEHVAAAALIAPPDNVRNINTH